MSLDMKVDGKSENRADDMAQGLLGRAMDRPEGLLKVTGKALYAAEDLPEDCAFGMLVSAPDQGDVTILNESEIRNMPGVLAVIRDPRMIRNAAQGTMDEAPVQGVDRAADAGQAVARVGADSFEAARHAAQKVEMELSGAQGSVDPQAVETEESEGNRFVRGDLEGAMTGAAHKVDAVYTT
ncbi:xanthine dehydrogenase family protein molybdopterin-binding subunit, partial [Cribrihabitans sp. XS_ASV171]